MGWATPIRHPNQVVYRTAEDCGCDQAVDAQVEYRLADGRDLRWIGSGLAELDLTAGDAVDVEAAHALMDGRDWRTGEQLVRRKQVLDPRGKVTARIVVDAITAQAAEDGMSAAEYLGNDALAKRFARAERGITRDGERHLLPVADAERLAAAAGLSADTLYGADTLAEARRFQDHHVDIGLRGVDVVLDLPKSISAAYAVAPDELSAAIEDAWMESVTEAVGALEEWTAYGMSGHHGDGERAERIATSGLLGWTTLHRSARPVDASPGDPHLHVHVNIAHLARGVDGQWRTIAAGAEDLHRHARVTNEIAEARLRQKLTERHGARFERSETTGAWELTGIDEQLRAAYSRRHQQVLDLAGQDASRDEQKAAARITAEAKEDQGGRQETVRRDWHSRAVDVLGSDSAVQEMVAAALPGPDGPTGPSASAGGGPLLPGPEQIATQIWDPEHGLTASRKSVQHTHVLSVVAQTLPYLDSVEQLLDLTDATLAADGHAVRLPDSNRHHHSHRQRYTHTSVVAAEYTLTETATAGLNAGLAQLTEQAAELALSTTEAAQDFLFSAEQRAVLMRLLTAGHAADAVIGVAGAGKTTIMAAARTGWEAAGLRVVGASTAAVAAANLAAEAGIESQTVAAWTRRIDGGRGLPEGGVLVIDEAAMVDDRALAALLRHAAETGTKVAGVGDPLQLRAVGIGGGFARIHELVGGLALTENRRQRDVVERAALQDWRDGGRRTALAAFAAHGRVHADDTSTEALTSMLARWDTARTRWEGDPHGQVADLLLLAARREDVATLNAGARAVRVAAGELTGGRTWAVAGGGRMEFAAGDLVHIRKNDYRTRRGGDVDVLNGFRGVVTAVDAHQGVRVEWRRASPDGPRTESAWMSPADIAEGRVTHGYAMTIGSAQGLTANVTIAYGLHADAHSLYPALSRAREESHLHLPLADLEDEVTRIRLGEVRSDDERLERAVAAYGSILDSGADDVMVTDELADPVERPATADQARVAAATAISPAARARAEEQQRAAEDSEAAEAARIAAQGFPQSPQAAVEDVEEAGGRENRFERSEQAQEAPERPEERDEAEPEVAPWRQRPHGRIATPHLEPRAEKQLEHAARAEELAQAAERKAADTRAALASTPTPGQQLSASVHTVLDTAEQHARTAAAEAERERHAREEAAKAREARDAVQRTVGKSRLSLRLAGTSRKEQRELLETSSGRMIAAQEEAQRARSAAHEARTAAWDAVTESRHASLLAQHDPGRYRPRGDEDLQQRLAAIRHGVQGLAEHVDARRAADAQSQQNSAAQYRDQAAKHRETAGGLRSEQQLRESLSPEQRSREIRERNAYLQQQRQQRAEQQRRQREQYERSYRYDPPSQGRSGPSLGM